MGRSFFIVPVLLIVITMAHNDVWQGCRACLKEVFHPMEGDDLERLTEAAHVLHRPSGNLIYEEGDSAIEGYCVCQGTVELFKRIERGGALVLRTVYTNGLIGMDEILSDHRTYHTSARALQDVRLVGIPREEILHLATNSCSFSCAIARHLSRELDELRVEHAMFVEKPLAERLRAKLGELAERHGSPADGWIRIDLPLTNAELANLIGTTSGTVSMLLHDMKEQGLVERKGRRFYLRGNSNRIAASA